MTNDTPVILFAGDVAWTIASARQSVQVAAGRSVLPQSLAANVAAALRSMGYRGGPLVLALPSSWCLAATIDLSGLPHQDRKAVVYRLEDALPLAAEDVAADVVTSHDVRRALGVCVRVDRLRHTLDVLDAAGVNVQTITPLAMLVAQAVSAANKPTLVLIGDGGFVDVVAVENARPIAWGFSGDAAADVQLQIDLVSRQLSTAPVMGATGTSATGARALDRTPPQLAMTTARLIATGKTRPWVELRRDALAPRDRLRTHRRAINVALACAAALLLAIAAAAVVRAVQYERTARSAESAMADEFHRQFPNWDVPVNVAAIVQSEKRKLLDAAGETGGGASALASMRDVLGGVPASVKLSIDTMSFDTESFDMTGHANDPADVQAISASARAAGFDVAPPQSHREGAGGTWSFSISGTRTHSPGGAVAVGR